MSALRRHAAAQRGTEVPQPQFGALTKVLLSGPRSARPRMNGWDIAWRMRRCEWSYPSIASTAQRAHFAVQSWA